MPISTDIYHNPRSAKQAENVSAFLEIAKRYEWMNLYQPNKSKSPWLWRGEIPCVGGEYIIIDFWPHKGRAMREDDKPVSGLEEIRRIITEAIEESQEEPFSVIDEGQRCR